MSKKKKSIMDGYFDEPIEPIEINPFVEGLHHTTEESEVLKKIEEATPIANAPISSRSTEELTSKFEFYDDDRFSPIGALAKKITSAKREQTDNEETTLHKPKLRQSEAKSEPLHESKLSQSEAKVESKRALPAKLNPKVEPQPEPLHESKLSQSEAKVEPVGTFESLVGLQRDALLFVFDSCLNSGSKISGAITISNLAIGLRSTVAAVRKAIQRLEQKGYISRFQFKDGRGGWTKYEIPHGIYSDLLAVKTRAKVEPNISQTRAKVEPQPEPQPEPRIPYSSSNNLNINTNTIELPESLRRFGISTVNLQALVTSGKTTQEVVERSLAALSFDVENGKSGNLANILFGVLGSGREYISQKYSESLQKELDEELARIQRAEESQRKLTETKLQIRFRTFLNENPTFLEDIRGQHRGFVQTQELLEKMAFEEFKAREINL